MSRMAKIFHSVPLPGADVWFAPGWVPMKERPRLFAEIMEQARWKQDHLTIQGQSIALPRLTAWHGEPGAAYGYSGINNEPAPWIAPLSELREELIAGLGAAFNSVLINLYRSGADSVSWHADNEAELGSEPVIASLSLGAPRKFSFKHRFDRSLRHDLTLSDGDLLVMKGSTQASWLHQVPKTKAVVGPRINLTFRMVITGVRQASTERE